ncbi:hypothetical protein [Hyphomicrobium sp. DY-1]|jgi:hypothetical protein|uniref:hypothetical protein n=1 Tax=Hyphomicrobium sp. DY-1 TaxID=3075650 RepID=UPI0039C166FC
MGWSSKVKEAARVRGETMVLAPGLDRALLAQERLLGRVEEPYDKTKAEVELKMALGSFKGKVQVPGGFAPWAQLEKAIEAAQQQEQAARIDPAPATEPGKLADTEAVKTKLVNDVIVQIFREEESGRDDEEEDEQAMGR